jgi:hypothetical protein
LLNRRVTNCIREEKEKTAFLFYLHNINLHFRRENIIIALNNNEILNFISIFFSISCKEFDTVLKNEDATFERVLMV